jgi:hypothetical protein
MSFMSCVLLITNHKYIEVIHTSVIKSQRISNKSPFGLHSLLVAIRSPFGLLYVLFWSLSDLTRKTQMRPFTGGNLVQNVGTEHVQAE